MASADYRVLGVHDRPVYTAGKLTADSTVQYEIPKVSPLSLAERGKLTQFSDEKFPPQFSKEAGNCSLQGARESLAGTKPC